MPLPAETRTAVPPETPAPSLTVEQRRQELAALRRRLADLRARYEATRRKETDLKQALAAAELNLQIQSAERRVVELRRAEAEREAWRAHEERDTAAKSAGARREDLAVRMAALYRLGRLGYLRPLASADSGTSFLAGLKVLVHLVRRDADLLGRYEESLRTLARLEEELSGRRRELGALAAEARRRERDLSAARALQAQLLARTRRSSEEERVAVSTLETKSERLASLLDLLESRGRSLPAGGASIRRFKGALDWPLRGNVALPFGRIANPRFPKTFLRSSGWILEAPPGSTVHAVFAGEVAYAQWLKGYGNVAVLDHGEGVFTLYGHLAPLTLARGHRVGLGDAVGVLAEPSADDDVAGLYFEIRDARASVDPAGWLR